MDESFFKYVQQLEIFAFFSGYPIVYALITFIKSKTKQHTFRHMLFTLLPFAYATVGVLYIGLQLQKLYPDFTITHISTEIQNPFLTIWALSSLFFWIPLLSKNPVITLFHSLVFFFMIAKNFYLQFNAPLPDNDVLKNYMRVYSDSIILNIGVLICVTIIYYIIKLIKKKRAAIN